MNNAYIVIYHTKECRRYCVVHAQTNKAAAKLVEAMPGVERVSEVRGPVREYTA